MSNSLRGAIPRLLLPVVLPSVLSAAIRPADRPSARGGKPVSATAPRLDRSAAVKARHRAATVGSGVVSAAPASPGWRCGPPRLAAGADSLDRTIVREMAARHVPGLSIAIVDRGRVTTRAYGWADLEHCVPATDSTLFGIGSISKHFAAVGALLLVQAGKLSLNDPITRYLPEGKGVWDSITVRHLLTHTSGIPDYCGDDDKYPSITLDRASSPETSALVRQIAAAKLNFRPGDDWAYSNTGYLLLSVLIERVSGQPFPTYMREHVFLPVGMTRTRFYSPVELIPDRATPYHVDSAGVATHGPFISDQFSRWGDMGMLSTARDMARWIQAMDSLRLLSPALWREMLTPVRLNPGWSMNYGFALWVAQLGGESLVFHFGSFRVGYTALFQRYGVRGLSAAVLTNHWGWRFETGNIMDAAVRTVDPTIMAVLRAPERPDPQPRLTRALLLALQGADAVHGGAPVTPAVRALTPRGLRAAAGLHFVECRATPGDNVGTHGTRVARECWYRMQPGGEPIAFLLTKGDTLAAAVPW